MVIYWGPGPSQTAAEEQASEWDAAQDERLARLRTAQKPEPVSQLWASSFYDGLNRMQSVQPGPGSDDVLPKSPPPV